MGNLVRIATYINRPNAESAKNFLQVNGIEAVLIADDAGGLRPELTMSQGIRLWVDAKDEAAARDLLQQAETPDPEAPVLTPEDTQEPRGFLSWVRKILKG
jgi:hypothetical protein